MEFLFTVWVGVGVEVEVEWRSVYARVLLDIRSFYQLPFRKSTILVSGIVRWVALPPIQSKTSPETVQTHEFGLCCCLFCKGGDARCSRQGVVGCIT